METPKQAAKRLVDKFTLVGLQRRNEGIQCALIAVEEILLEIMPKGARNGSQRCRELYWQDVKTEIEKLA